MILPAMLAVMSLFSCSDKEENDVIGDYKPIEVNKEVMEIPAEGGSDTIRITNVTGWKIYEVSVYVDGQLVEKPEPTQEYILYEGDWYTIKKEVEYRLIKSSSNCNHSFYDFSGTVSY